MTQCNIELLEGEFDLDEADVTTLILDPNSRSELDEEELCIEFFLGPIELDTPNNPALYTTLSGGLVVIECGVKVWYAAIPDCLPHAQIGDPIPGRWGITAINEAARSKVHDDRGLCDFRCHNNCSRCFG